MQISLKAYLPVTIEGMQAVLNPQGERLMEQYPGSSIILLIDGAELLIASLNPTDRQVQQAIWTESVIVSWIFHCALAAEIMSASLCAHIHRAATAEELQAAIAPLMGSRPLPDTSQLPDAAGDILRFRALYGTGIPGYDALIQQFGTPSHGLLDTTFETKEPARGKLDIPCGQP